MEVSGQLHTLAALTQWKNLWYWLGSRVSLDVWIKAKSAAGVSDHQKYSCICSSSVPSFCTLAQAVVLCVFIFQT